MELAQILKQRYYFRLTFVARKRLSEARQRQLRVTILAYKILSDSFESDNEHQWTKIKGIPSASGMKEPLGKEERLGYKIPNNFHYGFNKGVSLDVNNLKRQPEIPLFLLHLIIRVYTFYRKSHITSHQGCALRKIEGSPVLWTCEIPGAQHMTCMKK